MASTLVQFRVDTELKNEASGIFEQLGLDLPTAFRIFLKRSVDERGIPFDMRISQTSRQVNASRTKVELDKIIAETPSISNRKAFNALKKLNKTAQKNGTANMSLDEINKEIELYRSGV